jgi:hypothetical protein
MPMNSSGRFVADASRVMLMLDVLLARITPAGTMVSSSAKIVFFSASFSTAASTTN